MSTYEEEQVALTNDRLWNKKQLASYLGLSVFWIDKQLASIPHLKIGKCVRFDPLSFEFREWLDKHRIKAA
ncbi:MAG: hypothetical protein ACJ74J_11695 [Blastocatellia bacterium]